VSRRLDHRKLTAAWMEAYQALPPEELERIAQAADKYGGIYTGMRSEGSELVVSMAGVDVLRIERELLEFDSPRQAVQ